MSSIGVPEILLLALVLPLYIGVVAVPAAMICRRIGHPSWLGALALIPLLNVALLWYIALTRWNTAASNSHA